jgi:hypothetical protein
MRTVEIKVYSFDELGVDAQRQACEELADINITHQWWDHIYEDAKQIGFVIQNHTSRFRVQGEFDRSAAEMAAEILANHGASCDTYKHTLECLQRLAGIEEGDDAARLRDEVIELYRLDIRDDYRKMLQKEYEHALSDEGISETILANSERYEFTADGKLFSQN